MVKRSEVIEIMEQLETLGATAILETAITNCRLSRSCTPRPFLAWRRDASQLNSAAFLSTHRASLRSSSMRHAASRSRRHCAPRFACLALFALAISGGCRSAEKVLKPSNFRDWTPEQAVLPTAEVHGNQVTIHNVRNCQYFAADTYLVDYYDKSFDLSFGAQRRFRDGAVRVDAGRRPHAIELRAARPDGKSDHLAVSVEVRKEKHETYNPVLGSARQYELMYVVADERDVIRQRTNYRHENVYLYHTTATPEVSRELLADVLGRVNQAGKAARVLRHTHQQLHDEHRPPHRPSPPAPDHVRFRDVAPWLLRRDRLTTRA